MTYFRHLLKDIKRKASKRTELDRKVMQAGSSATLKDRNENVWCTPA